MISSQDLRSARVGDLIKFVVVNGETQAALTTATSDICVGVLANAVDPSMDTTGQAITVSMLSGGGVVQVNAVSVSAARVGQLVYASATAGKATAENPPASGAGIQFIGRVSGYNTSNSTYTIAISLTGSTRV